MQQKIKTVSAALMIGCVCFFLAFSIHIKGADVLAKTGCAGILRFVEGGTEELQREEAGPETGVPVLVSLSGRTAGNIQRSIPFAMAAMTFVFYVRKKRTGSFCVLRLVFPSSRFLHELLIRLKKDGKKRRGSFGVTASQSGFRFGSKRFCASTTRLLSSLKWL
ncbi:MAG TPA: hypothetical protein H9909_06345 [Candidatus Mediterraneibacter norfolkensis]|nr:hypothetical protein [Candidatus Mediterraneibacter norfolkensis]